MKSGVAQKLYINLIKDVKTLKRVRSEGSVTLALIFSTRSRPAHAIVSKTNTNVTKRDSELSYLI